MLHKIVYIAVLSLGMFFVSCGKKAPFFEENKSIEDKTWKVEDTVSFTFDIQDTSQLYDFYFNLRNSGSYEFSNLFIFYQLTFPNNKKLTDTAEFILAQPDGKWLGKSISGSIIENSMLFSQKKQFPLAGKYTFSVIHGMRKEDLEHIVDVGFKIEKVDEH